MEVKFSISEIDGHSVEKKGVMGNYTLYVYEDANSGLVRMYWVDSKNKVQHTTKIIAECNQNFGFLECEFTEMK